jgi:haloalkane dehalogenase
MTGAARSPSTGPPAANIAGLDTAEHELVAGHHTPEDQPDAIATAIAAWMDKHSLRSDHEDTP